MILSKLKCGCKVGFFGLGSSNAALLRCLPLDKCELTLRSDTMIDRGSIPNNIKVKRILEGKSACQHINEDIIFFSPSVRRDRPELKEAKARGVFFSSDAELFFENNNTQVFAVTGSDGKSTTATLTHLLLSAGGYTAPLIGNIGEPFVKNLERNTDFFVCELSSFMLTYFTPGTRAACITNITPNHLDWHSDFEEYRQTKLSVARKTDRLIISDDCLDVSGAYGIISGERSYYELRKLYNAEIYMTVEVGKIRKNGIPIIDISRVFRKEKHNLNNLMMAIGMTDGMVGNDEINAVAKDFQGLGHRCECFLNKNGVDYIDSSIDSSPARTTQTLRSLGRPVVIILGGRGKGLDYGELLPEVKKYVKKAIITGENAEEIFKAIGEAVNTEIIEDFEEAVLRGKKCAAEVGTLLLSPASTSYDRFKNYAERGDKFKQILLKND